MKNPYDCTGHIELNRNKNMYYLASNNIIISCTNFSFFYPLCVCNSTIILPRFYRPSARQDIIKGTSGEPTGIWDIKYFVLLVKSKPNKLSYYSRAAKFPRKMSPNNNL